MGNDPPRSNFGVFRMKKLNSRSGNPGRKNWFFPQLDILESRSVPATFTVANLDDGGPGSFRQALLIANSSAGSDSILFSVSGSINLLSALPLIVDTVNINALSTTEPLAPTVEIQSAGHAGLVFDIGSQGSVLTGLSVVGALGDGITLKDSGIQIQSCYIGIGLDGTTVVANGGDGIRIDASSTNNVIGNADPLSSVDYFDTTGLPVPVSGWQGIRGGDTVGEYLISGTSGANGLLYVGPINGVGGTSYQVNYPGALTTSVYGPDNVGNGEVQLVGSYRTGEDTVLGFIYQGALADLANPEGYRTLAYPGAKFNYIHSVMGNLAVGNADGPEGDYPLGPGQAILYEANTGQILGNIVYPGSLSNTAYAIWDNGQGKYTIAGGFALPGEGDGGIGHGYLVDYNSLTGEYTNWKQYDAPISVPGREFITHFEALSSVENGVYTLSADTVEVGVANSEQGWWVSVRREADNSFGEANWVAINYKDVDPTTLITTSDSVFGNQIVGLAGNGTAATPFQATLNFEFQLSNVISGNAGNGIGVYGANANRIGMNFIGTDVTGTVDLGNGQNGILVTAGARGNVIGGQATGGNDPTDDVIVRPPMGNLISGNEANGVLINDLSTLNILSGNFIGTTNSGNAALGNVLDGIAIENADRNEIIGCTLQQNPFVFYNVSSGNGGNGLRITDSDDIIVHANFLGAGANNTVIVPNALNGLLVEGTSTNTQVGGVIPLGNVISGNTLNGIEVRDQVSGFVSFNTFAGLFAFGVAAPNGLDGILITSTGGNNLLRTNVTSGNLGNGIHISGDAQGVTVDPNMVGLNTIGSEFMPNGRNGLLVDGNAHNNIIGGTRQSIIPQNTFSGNSEAGISFQGNAHDNTVYNAVIGLNTTQTGILGNTLAGIILGPGTFGNVIGSSDSQTPNYIGGNGGGGILIDGSNNNLIRNTFIGSSARLPIAPNTGNGIVIRNGNQNRIGVNGLPNTIAFQSQNGIEIESGSQNRIINNSIYDNVEKGISILPGANNNQPAPVLTEATFKNSSTIQIRGTLAAAPNGTFLVQIFANPEIPAHYQGKTLLGTVSVSTNAEGEGSFTAEYPFVPNQGIVYTATAADDQGNSSGFSEDVSLPNIPVFPVGTGQGGSPVVNVYHAKTSQFLYSFLAFDAGFLGGVRVAMGDVTGDNIPEIIVSAGVGGGPNVRVFNAATGTPVPGSLGSFMAFGTGFTGGVFVTAGDVNGDGTADIICGAGAGGGPNVRVYSGATGAQLSSFYAFDSRFAGGVTVAAGDVTGDSKAEIICGAGAGGGPNVRIFDGSNLSLLKSFYAFDPTFTGGVYVACGDTDGNGFAEVIVGAGAGGSPTVSVFRINDFDQIATYQPYGAGFKGGVRVGVAQSHISGKVNIVTGPGTGGGPQVQVYDTFTSSALDNFFAFAPDFLGGIFVG